MSKNLGNQLFEKDTYDRQKKMDVLHIFVFSLLRHTYENVKTADIFSFSSLVSNTILRTKLVMHLLQVRDTYR